MGKLKLLLLLSAITLLITMVMSFIIFYQQRKFADLENSIRGQNCSLNMEVQSKRLSDIETLISNLSSSLSSASIKLETKLQDVDSQISKLSEINTLKRSSSVNSLPSKPQNTGRRVVWHLSDSDSSLEDYSENESLCTSGWIRFQSKCYFFSLKLKNWDEARNSCRSENSTLVKVETEEELIFLNHNRKNYWVGLTDETTGEWRWDDGSPFVRNSDWWHEGQPDNWDSHGLGGGEDCAQLTWSGKLNDNHCSLKMAYICQI